MSSIDKEKLITLKNLGLYTTEVKKLIAKNEIFIGTKDEFDAAIASGEDWEGKPVIILDDEDDKTIEHIVTQISTIDGMIGNFETTTSYTNLTEYIESVENNVVSMEEIQSIFNKGVS